MASHTPAEAPNERLREAPPQGETAPEIENGPIPLERFAAIGAALDTGAPRNGVLRREGVSAEAWAASQQAWLGRMAAEAKRNRFETASRYAALFDAERKKLAETSAIPARAARRAEPAPPQPPAKPALAAEPQPAAVSAGACATADGRGVGAPSLSAPIAPMAIAQPSLSFDAARSPAQPTASPSPPPERASPWAAAQSEAKKPAKPSLGSTVAIDASMIQEALRRASLPFQGGARPPATGLPAPGPKPGGALPFQGTAAPAPPPSSPGASPALPFQPAAGAASAAPPATSASPHASSALPAGASLAKKRPGTVVFDAPPPAAPAIPFQGGAPTPKDPKPQSSVGLPFRSGAPGGAVAPKQVSPPGSGPQAAAGRPSALPAQPAARPDAVSPPSGASAARPSAPGPRLSIEQLASLAAEIATRPSEIAAVRARYGLDEASHAAESDAWQRRFAADQALFARFKSLFDEYRAWLARTARR